MTRSVTIQVPDNVREEDLNKMISALSSYRGEQWWFREENPIGGKRCLAPLVLQNMKLQLEAGTIEPNMTKFSKLIETAIYYESKAREAVLVSNPEADAKALG